MGYVVNDTQDPGSSSPQTPGSGPTAFEPPLVQPFLNQAQNIALSLHHREIQPAHLLLAISLIPRGARSYVPTIARSRPFENAVGASWRRPPLIPATAPNCPFHTSSMR